MGTWDQLDQFWVNYLSIQLDERDNLVIIAACEAAAAAERENLHPRPPVSVQDEILK